MQAFEMLPVETIREWLRMQIDRNSRGGQRRGVTFNALSDYMDIPLNSFKCLAYMKKCAMSPERQMHFSKVISMIENGQLEFQEINNRGTKKGVIVDNPRPIIRYKPEFTATGPKLTTVNRPRPAMFMPKFKDVVLK